MVKSMTGVIAFNGSPRQDWNTATLLEKALEGASSEGAKTDLIHLYDINFKGCTSCFSCKVRDGKSYAHCAMKDELTPILKRIEEEADAIILGSPIYFRDDYRRNEVLYGTIDVPLPDIHQSSRLAIPEKN